MYISIIYFNMWNRCKILFTVHPSFTRQNASDIHRFFRAVTMSVSNHSKRQAPNERLKLDFSDVVEGELADDDFELDF